MTCVHSHLVRCAFFYSLYQRTSTKPWPYLYLFQPFGSIPFSNTGNQKEMQYPTGAPDRFPQERLLPNNSNSEIAPTFPLVTSPW